MGDLHQTLGLAADFPRHIHPARVAEPAVMDDRDVDVQDIPGFQHLGARNAVADDMVHRNAAGMRVAAVTDGGRGRAGVLHHLLDGDVDRARRLARHDHGRDPVENIRRDPPGSVHAGEILGLVNANTVLGQAALEVVQNSSPGQGFDAKLMSLRDDFQSARRDTASPCLRCGIDGQGDRTKQRHLARSPCRGRSSRPPPRAPRRRPAHRPDRDRGRGEKRAQSVRCTT